MTVSNVILSIKDLKVNYGSIQAVKGINIEVRKGQVVAILGANGAGKTTTLRTISGLIEPSSGTIELNSQEITKMTADKITSLGIVQAPEGRAIFRDLTVAENLRVGAFTIKNKSQIKANFERVYKYFPILKERQKQISSTLSGGEQQMLAIGRALMANPKILLLDEPSLGLAPIIVRNIFEIIKQIKKEGTTVLIVEQNALQTLKVADYAYVLEVGQIHMEGEAHVLIKDNNLIEAYLGGHKS